MEDNFLVRLSEVVSDTSPADDSIKTTLVMPPSCIRIKILKKEFTLVHYAILPLEA